MTVSATCLFAAGAIVLAVFTETMAQLLVRHLEPAVKEALQRRARRHGRSMEEEVRQILRQVVQAESPVSASEGFGSRIAALFADLELEQTMPEWRGEEALPALVDS